MNATINGRDVDLLLRAAAEMFATEGVEFRPARIARLIRRGLTPDEAVSWVSEFGYPDPTPASADRAIREGRRG